MRMNRDVTSLLAEAQFLLAQVLWEPRIDRSRALRIARIAAKTHPDPRARAAIAEWFRERNETEPSPLDELALEQLERELRAAELAPQPHPLLSPRRHPLPPPRRYP